MKAVGKVGSFLSRSVYTVSGPFHPFGGAVDIIVVEQQDGSFKSSPWYVRFGKFQGVLKAKEKVVGINVNGVEADFHMYLDHKGEAYFLKEVDVGEEDTLPSPSSSGEDTDGQSNDRRALEAKSCNFDAYQSESVTEIDLGNRNVISRTNSRRSRILGFVFGRKSIKKGNLPKDEDVAGVVRSESLERAEIAADLLEVKWSTNLASPRRRKDSASRPSSQVKSEASDCKLLMTQDRDNNVESLANGNNLTDSILLNEFSSANGEEGCRLKRMPTKSERPVVETGLEMSCITAEDVIGTSSVEVDEPNLRLATKTDNILANDTGASASLIDVISDIASNESKIQDSVNLEDCPGNNKTQGSFSNAGFATDGNRDDPSFLYCETSVSSTLELDDSNKQGHGALHLSSGGSEHIFAETVQTTGLVCEGNSKPSSDANANETSSSQELLENQSDCFFSIDEKTTSSRSMENGVLTGTYSQMITLQPVYASAEDIESPRIFTISTSQAVVEKTLCGEDQISKCEPPVKRVVDPIQLNILTSEISEEEQLLFGDFDDFTPSSVRHLEEPISPDYNEKEGDPPCLQVQTEEVNDSFIPGTMLGSSENKSFQVKLSDDNLSRKLRTVSSHIDIPATSIQSKEVSRIARSLPNMLAHNNNILSNANKDEVNDIQSSKSEQMAKDTKSIEELKNEMTNPAIDTTKRKIGIEDGEDLPKRKVTKKKTRLITPTSEQLASLNLKGGRNSIVFTFSTPMLGKQQVDARIYLWKWDTRVVISDVDGTITRSDLLGQFMPLVGVDWSQTGVAHLFSAIKENGYQLLFLSARAISQAYNTRQFLLNLKQDGKVLPEGPVVISPDGLFPSLYREVVRRAPHEFKIACLEEIKALFPPDRIPFYAGFGNRDTDEISYLKVGIPKGKIFIINPKGEIVVNRRVDTKSYTSLHALVHDMFPPMSSSEQEDYNSWNYWKLPPPAFDI
ncbi:phosphatidate phosphatase PAH1-like [Coffea eugenioides]|uniref:phosphatidate phosphatase PAH1-like n=1 Tax=Coffea eugenioides TaxID=49369 RepID=UPI000F61316D|nr:phosphatidate phosphatase PAH1-like [Coffea eugenioides]XP_027149354.1 phosphatidate phosphatase PAH1-like [Coffea eugenioides]